MSLSALNYLSNLARLAAHNRMLRPLAAVYYAATDCNLGCAYCETLNGLEPAVASLEDAVQILRVLRSGVDRLILTGGEPLLHPQIGELASAARNEIGFRRIALFTNGLLLPQHEEILPLLDLLVVSLDSVDPGVWHGIIGVERAAADAILNHICDYARRQREFGYRMVVNCVLTPETLSGAHRVLDFCVEYGLSVSFSPQGVNNWPNYDLLTSEQYADLLDDLLECKRHGAPIVGSEAYLRTLRDLRPYSCYPTLIPCVLPGGELIYPCRPVEKGGGAHGGRPVNLLQVGSWQEALNRAAEAYGPPPRVCNSCYQQCFMEPALMQARPLSLLYELIRYPASRRAMLASYAPG